MMEPLSITLTKAGYAAIIADDTPGFTSVQIAQIGLTDAVFTVASTLTALPGEFTRLPVSGEQSGDDIIHVTALDDSDAAYSYRGFALYLDDGTLFAVYGQATAIAGKAEVSATHLAIDIQLSGGMASAITFGDTNFLNPPATTTRKGVVELATVTEAKAGVDTTRAITPSSAKAAVLDWIGTDPTEINAGKLDDKEAADFALLAAFDFGSNAHGYWRKSPDGDGGTIIEQWGAALAGESGSPPPLDFPIAFTDFDSINLQVCARTPNTAATNGDAVGGNKVSTSQFNVFSDDNDRAVFWRAIGV